MSYEIKGLRDECGVFGIWGHNKAAEMTYYGLHAMQHRGQDGAGVVINNGKEFVTHKNVGLVNDVFEDADFSKLQGHAAIGHIRSATKDTNDFEHVQPMKFEFQNGSMALAHNGNIMNSYDLRGELESEGSILQTSSDSEMLAHLIKRDGKSPSMEAIKKALRQTMGAYSFVILTEDMLYVALDPHAIRPLSIGSIGDTFVVASETCAFDLIGAKYEREVLPGELLAVSDNGIESMFFAQKESRKLCTMEYVYLSRPDSNLNDVNVHASRKRMGIELAKETAVEADVVTGVPDSSISAAIGYAEHSGLPYELGIIKNRYIGRTFIKPSQELREQGVKMKLSPVRGIVEGKRVIMIDDSIIRGTTCKRIVGLLREAGATEVHVRIASPPITSPCYYGVDMSTKEELFAANYALDDMCEMIGADSLAFLSLDGVEKAIVQTDDESQSICKACFTGNYFVESND
ncbi:MAG TPA: amidophosphoribosyltransferase [Bacillota bacterium]|nr:amidophosphoribosyltransferase [Bacillota bacterium]